MSAPAGRLFTPAFVTLGVCELAYFTAAGMLIATIPFFVTGPLESGKAAVGVAVGVFSVTTLVLRPWVGRLSDRHGRRPLLLGGAVLCAAVILAHLTVDDLWLLVVLRLGARRGRSVVLRRRASRCSPTWHPPDGPARR